MKYRMVGPQAAAELSTIWFAVINRVDGHVLALFHARRWAEEFRAARELGLDSFVVSEVEVLP